MNAEAKFIAEGQSVPLGVFLSPAYEFIFSRHDCIQSKRQWLLGGCSHAVVAKWAYMVNSPARSRFHHPAQSDRSPTGHWRDCLMDRWPRTTLEREFTRRNPRRSGQNENLLWGMTTARPPRST